MIYGSPKCVTQICLRLWARSAATKRTTTSCSPTRTQHKEFSDLGAVCNVLDRLKVIEKIDEVCGPRRPHAATLVVTNLALVTLHRVVAPHSKLGFADWWDKTSGPR